MADEQSYRPERVHPIPSSQAAAAGTPQPLNRRRLTQTELHEHRVAWGKKWGKLVSDAVREALEGTE